MNVSYFQSLALLPNSTAVKWWIRPPLDPELRIHLFNYTNADRYMKGLDKTLKVEDLGPYVYIEKFEKVNVTFNNNFTISYRVSITHFSFHVLPLFQCFYHEKCFFFSGKSIVHICTRKI